MIIPPYSTKYSYVEGAEANSTTMLLAGIQNGGDAEITYTYDAIGNPLNYRNGMNMTWVNGRRLATVTNSGVTTTYTYNDDGIRLTKKVGNNPVVTYETDGGLILCQKTGAGSSAVYVYFFYDESGNAYAMEYEGDMYYYLRNCIKTAKSDRFPLFF